MSLSGNEDDHKLIKKTQEDIEKDSEENSESISHSVEQVRALIFRDKNHDINSIEGKQLDLSESTNLSISSSITESFSDIAYSEDGCSDLCINPNLGTESVGSTEIPEENPIKASVDDENDYNVSNLNEAIEFTKTDSEKQNCNSNTRPNGFTIVNDSNTNANVLNKVEDGSNIISNESDTISNGSNTNVNGFNTISNSSNKDVNGSNISSYESDTGKRQNYIVNNIKTSSSKDHRTDIDKRKTETIDKTDEIAKGNDKQIVNENEVIDIDNGIKSDKIPNLKCVNVIEVINFDKIRTPFRTINDYSSNEIHNSQAQGSSGQCQDQGPMKGFKCEVIEIVNYSLYSERVEKRQDKTGEASRHSKAGKSIVCDEDLANSSLYNESLKTGPTLKNQLSIISVPPNSPVTDLGEPTLMMINDFIKYEEIEEKRRQKNSNRKYAIFNIFKKMFLCRCGG